MHMLASGLGAHTMAQTRLYTARAILLASPARSRAAMTSFRQLHQLNASGLTSSQTKALKERSAQPHESKVIQAIKEMYSCSPTETTFSVYAENSQFHDPVGIAKGPGSIRAQFIGLAKIFPKATIPKFRILQNPPELSKNTILIDQDVSYFRDPSKEPTKTLNSLLTIETNDKHQIVKHTEEWNHEKTTSSDDGFLGMLNEQRKKLTASLTNMMVGKEPKA